MSRNFILPLLLTIGLGFGSAANAVLIDNGNTTIDTASGLEWLDLTLTQGQSYNSIVGGFGGYLAAGYTLATGTQMCGLWSALGDVLPGCGGLAQGAMGLANGNTLLSLLGPTFGAATIGMYDAGTLGAGTVGVGCLNIGVSGCSSSALGPSIIPGWLTFGPIFSVSTTNAGVGHYLVRAAAVPEPGTLALLGLGLAGLAVARRRRLTT